MDRTTVTSILIGLAMVATASPVVGQDPSRAPDGSPTASPVAAADRVCDGLGTAMVATADGLTADWPSIGTWAAQAAASIRTTRVPPSDRAAVRDLAAELDAVAAEIASLDTSADGPPIEQVLVILDRLESASSFAEATAIGPLLTCDAPSLDPGDNRIDAVLGTEGLAITGAWERGPPRIEVRNDTDAIRRLVVIDVDPGTTVESLLAALDAQDGLVPVVVAGQLGATDPLQPGAAATLGLVLLGDPIALLVTDAAGVAVNDPSNVVIHVP